MKGNLHLIILSGVLMDFAYEKMAILNLILQAVFTKIKNMFLIKSVFKFLTKPGMASTFVYLPMDKRVLVKVIL